MFSRCTHEPTNKRYITILFHAQENKEANTINVTCAQHTLGRLGNDAVITHKCLKGLSPSYLSEKFSTRAIIHDRQTNRYNKPNPRFFNHQLDPVFDSAASLF